MEPYLFTIFWAALFIVALIVESQTAELVAIWFIPGILVSLVLSFVDAYWWVQIVVFAAISIVLLTLAFTIFRKKILKNHGSESTDTDLLLEKDAMVVEEICNTEMRGAVKIDGRVWSARLTDDSEIASVGELVAVERIAGVKLICRKK